MGSPQPISISITLDAATLQAAGLAQAIQPEDDYGEEVVVAKTNYLAWSVSAVIVASTVWFTGIISATDVAKLRTLSNEASSLVAEGSQGITAAKQQPRHAIQKKWMELAKAEIGVRERKGSANNPRIVKYHQSTSLKAKKDSTPWCASFVSYVLEESGTKSMRSARARDYLKWGHEAVSPKYGDIVVMRRGRNEAQGHVGFLVKTTRKRVYVLGGNQPRKHGKPSDRVNILDFPKSRVLSYRTLNKPSIAAKKHKYLELLAKAEKKHGIKRGLLKGVSWHESAGMRADVVSGAYRNGGGDIGIMQFSPATAEWLKVDATNPVESIDAAGKYLKGYYDKFNDWSLAALAYNWGGGNVKRALKGEVSFCSTHKITYPTKVFRKSRIFGADVTPLHREVSKCLA